jgi:2-phosphosulfolactate phosphatase
MGGASDLRHVDLNIIQGTAAPYPAADINIVIDVIRAFTASHVAFLRGVPEIFLVNTTAEAFALRQQHPGYLLAGEIDGLPIDGFDLDNSPHTFSVADIAGKSLVQKTTNGVKGTLLALNAETVLVTGLSNARNAALYARQLAAGRSHCKINVVATHPQDDDDLACAEYIRDILLGANALRLEDIARRIRDSCPAQKFFDAAMPAFNEKDIAFCTREVPCDFVMRVDRSQALPRVVKQTV